MNTSIGLRRLLLTAALALGSFGAFAVSLAEACNVPVFRYALEHWQPDAYRGVLFHRGPLSTSEQQRLDTLREKGGRNQFNLAIRTVDLDSSPEPADRELLSLLGNPELPRLVVLYPVRSQINQPAWSGPFDNALLSALVDSPVRHELLHRLTAGQTGVWLMVDCGDSRQDDAAAKTLEQELKRLQQTLELPKLTDAPEDVIQEGPPLRVEFSLLRIRRNDPAEQPLIAMLLGSESDLASLNEPVVFPVFGRSRALMPLIGAGISRENVQDSAKFLAGACSCQVKELNPGFDLLMTADWAKLLTWAKSPPMAAAALAVPAETEPELVPIPGGSKPESSSPAAGETISTESQTRLPAAGPESSLKVSPLLVLVGALVAALVVAVARR